MPLAPPRSSGKEIVLSPQEALAAGASAEQLEEQVHASFKAGIQHVLVDLRGVPHLDSAGIRAIIRGHTSAQRPGRRFTLIGPNTRVRDTLSQLRLLDVVEIADSVDHARSKPMPWHRVITFSAVFLIGIGLVFVGFRWPSLGFQPTESMNLPLESASQIPPWSEPLFQLAKLAVAAVVGMLVTVVHRQYRTDREPNPTMDQAQVLLCISGALMMIIIGSSLARAFGIAGAAAIIRFRTPIEDAKDITVLFILMGLGMAAGLGGFALAGLGTLFLCGMLPLLNVFSTPKPRLMMVEIVAKGRQLPFDKIQHVFAVNHVSFEPREVSQGNEATVRYLTTLRQDASIEELSGQLMKATDGDLENVSWFPAKRS
jgi:anti-anti-sigma factor